MAIYKAVLNGQFQGQDIKNLLYYRTGVGVDISGLTIGGTEEVARAIVAMVWPSMKALESGSYELQDISVYAYHDNPITLLYQNPFTLAVQEFGTLSEEMSGPEPCAIVRFDLEPTPLLLDGPKPPKRGYIAFGPIGKLTLTESGEINRDDGFGAKWDALTAALSSNIETVLPPALFFPIRVHHDMVLGVLQITSFADVKNATVRNVGSFRRSRQPEL